MVKITTIFLLLASLAGMTARSQAPEKQHPLTGKYIDPITELELLPDSTFILKTPDDLFPYTHTSRLNRGTWTAAGNVVTLNPGKEKRRPQVSMTEKSVPGLDSICIKVSYVTEVHENEALIGKESLRPDIMTLYINKYRNYRNLVTRPIRRVCTFSPRVRKQVLIDSTHTLRMPLQAIEKLGIYTYNFSHPAELIPADPSSNYFEITIVQPLDKERMPRSKQVVIKGRKAFFYELRDRVPTSEFVFNALRRVGP